MTPPEQELPEQRPAPARRHPTEVTAARISEHIAAYTDHLTPTEVGQLDRAYRVLGLLPERLRSTGGDEQ